MVGAGWNDRGLAVPDSAVLIGIGGAACMSLLIIGGSGALLELTCRNTALNTSPDRVTYRNLFGVVRTFRREQIRDVFTCSVESHWGHYYSLALFGGRDGKLLFRICTDFWDGL